MPKRDGSIYTYNQLIWTSFDDFGGHFVPPHPPTHPPQHDQFDTINTTKIVFWLSGAAAPFHRSGQYTYIHICTIISIIYSLSGRKTGFIDFSSVWLPDLFQEISKTTVKQRAARSPHAATTTGKQTVKNVEGNSGENFQIGRIEQRSKRPV